MKRFADDINQQLITEARLVAQTRIDLEAFLALPREVRAAQWRGWNRQAKADVVIQMIVQIWIERWGAEDAGEAWSEALVQHWIDRYDERWGTEQAAEEAPEHLTCAVSMRGTATLSTAHGFTCACITGTISSKLRQPQRRRYAGRRTETKHIS